MISLRCLITSSPRRILFELLCAEALCGLMIRLFLIVLAVCSMKNILTYWMGCLPLLKSTPSWNCSVAPLFSRWIIRLPCVHFLFADRGPRGFLQFLGPESDSEFIYLGELSAPAVFLPCQSTGTTVMCL